MSGSTHHRGSFVIPKPFSFNQTREKERFELSTLNDKFADYVEKVRYLEAQNKKTQMDTNFLTEKEEENCQKIKTLFETEITQLKEVAAQLFNNESTTFTNSQDAQNSISSLKQHLNKTFQECDSSKYETEKLEQQLSSVEGDILMYKRRLAHQDNEHAQWKQFLTDIQRLLSQAKNEIHSENLIRTSCEKKIKQICIDKTRLYEQQQQKLKDLKQSSTLLNSNSTNDRAHIFKFELSNAIKKIRQDFEKQNDLHRNNLYEQFTQSYENISRQYPELSHLFLNDPEQVRIKQEEELIRSSIQNIRRDSQLLKQKNSELKLCIRELQINIELSTEENKRIQQLQQNQINQFKLKHEKTKKNYDEVITRQITLEKEIGTYRNLLEGTMKPVIDHITEEYNTMTNNQVKIEQRNELSNKTTRSKSADRISSASFIENTGDTNSFISSTTWNNKNHPTDVSNFSTTTKSLEDLNLINNNNDQRIVEKIETKNSSSRSKIRPTIIIQTRRNK